MTKKSIYLDNSATTPISESALSTYNRIATECYGNPSSLHEAGFFAEREISHARDILLASLSAKDSAAVFTASGSEANNLAIIGRAFSKERYRKGSKIITTLGEHASVSEPLERLRSLGFDVVAIPTAGGAIDKEALLSALDERVILISMMMVNNETGALYDTAYVSKMMRMYSPEAVLHVDATQSYLKLPFTKASVGADMITVSSHKIHGPKGVGALIIDKKIIKSRGLSPIILGGGQEGGLRSGTENVPGIAAFGAAIDEGRKNLQSFAQHTGALREYLLEKLSEGNLSEITPTLPESHAPHIINITLPKIKSETMLHFLSSEGIYVSSGSACSSNDKSHKSSALIAYGKSEAEADSSIRISFSLLNSREDVDALSSALSVGLSRLARMK